MVGVGATGAALRRTGDHGTFDMSGGFSTGWLWSGWVEQEKPSQPILRASAGASITSNSESARRGNMRGSL